MSSAKALIAAIAGVAWILLSPLVTAATIEVTSNGDTVAVDGGVTLREALESVNAGTDVNADVTAHRIGVYGGIDAVTFNIPPGGVQTIRPASALFANKPVNLDATTQPGFAGVPLIVLDGSSNSGSGFVISGGNSTVRGFNIQSFATGAAIALQSLGAAIAGGNKIAGNYIGIDQTGTQPRRNNGNIDIADHSPDNVIGGTTAADRNVVAGYNTSGLEALSQGNLVVGNYFGTDATGTVVIPSPGTAVRFDYVPGGTYTRPSSVIGNVVAGGGAVALVGTSPGTPANAVVQGNLIGTDHSGLFVLGGGGVLVQNVVGPTVTIGGIGASPPGSLTGGPGNLITGGYYGILLFRASQITIQGNKIVNNAYAGISLRNVRGGLPADPPENVTIGRTNGGPGDVAAAGNIIAQNGGPGVLVGEDCIGAALPSCAEDTGNSVLGNSIYGNAGLGIDLVPTLGQPNPNDAGDVDLGANNGQNYPVITSTVFNGVTGLTTINGTLDSVAGTTYRIEFFSGTTCHAAAPNDYGEGQNFLGFINVATNGAGNATFSQPYMVPATQLVVTATATDPTGSTSEFSKCNVVPPTAPTITSIDNTTFAANNFNSFTVVAIGIPTPTITESGALPAGVTFNSGTHMLSGTAATGTGGTYTITFTAANGVLPDAHQTFTLKVNEAPKITSAAATTFSVGAFGTFTVTASGLPAPQLVESGALPAGVTFNTATGVLSGTPGPGTAGVYPLIFAAQNGVPPNASQSFTLTVDEAPKITSAPVALFPVGSFRSFTVTATGFPAPTFSVAGALPAGVAFDTTTGVLSGTAGLPVTAYPLVFTATNGALPNATQNFSLVVTPPLVQRAFVASYGVDSDPCSRPQPCRSFAAAIARSLPYGEVIVLNSAGYGPFTITQPVTVSSPPGVYAGVTVVAGSGIVVNAPAGTVTLRGLTLNALGGAYGIEFRSADVLYVDRVNSTGFLAAGIAALTSSNSTIQIRDSKFRRNGSGGIFNPLTAGGLLDVEIERTQFQDNIVGVLFSGNAATATLRRIQVTGGDNGVMLSPSSGGSSRVNLRSSTIAGALVCGIDVVPDPGASALLTLVSSMLVNNGTGLQVQTGGDALVSDTTIVRNGTGVDLGLGGTASSSGDNQLLNNGFDGGFSSSTPKQ